jgi:tetratricopeptide (TPR) repeat protein
MDELQGNTEEAHTLFSQSLEVLKPIGDRYSLFHPVGDTAVIALNKGELNTAKTILEESIRAFEELKNRAWVSISIQRLAEVLYRQGEYENARNAIQRNLEIVTELNDLNGISWNTYLLGKVDLAEGKLSSARQKFNDAMVFDDTPEIADKAGGQLYIGWVEAALGLIDCYEGKFEHGKKLIEIGIEKVRKQYAPNAAHLLTYRSHAFWLEKDLQSAARSYRDTIKELHGNFYFIRIPECLEGLGKIAVMQNDFERAARLFGAAEAMREKMGTPIPPVMRGEYDQHVQILREKIGTTFETVRNEGRALTLEQATALALEE